MIILLIILLYYSIISYLRPYARLAYPSEIIDQDHTLLIFLLCTAHPNILAFYSHCGLLSTTEAIHHGVPIVGMPIYADQPVNAAAIEEKGFGVQIQYSELTKDTLLEKFRTVLNPE